MSREALEQVAGYRERRDELDLREANGTDYRQNTDSVWSTVNRFHPDRLQLTVDEIVDETPSTKTLRLRAGMLPIRAGTLPMRAKTLRARPENADLPPFEAGQYVNLFVDINGATTSRPFAISSAPQQLDHYDLTVKRLPGGLVSNYLLDEIVVGDTLESTGPMGSFHYNPLWQGDDLVFLAGGSGSAPALSMIRDMIARNPPRRFHLVCGSQNENDIIFTAELDRLVAEMAIAPLAKESPDRRLASGSVRRDQSQSARQEGSQSARQWELTVTHVVSNPSDDYEGRQGFIDAALIDEVVPDPQTCTFFICGPPAMHDFCLPEVLKLGVPRRRIRLEANGAPVKPASRIDWTPGVDADDQFTVRLPDGRRIKASATTPLLDTLERNNAGFTLAACRSGECSLCRLKLVAGTVYEPEEAKVRRTDRDQGYIHSCVSYPTSDLTLDY